MKKTILLLLIALLIIPFSGYAQRNEINYSGTLLSVGPESAFEKYPFRISNYDGLIWTRNNISLLFKTDVDGVDIGSNANAIEFYNSAAGYNAIRCSRFYVISDARLKEDIKPINSVLETMNQNSTMGETLRQSAKQSVVAVDDNQLNIVWNLLRQNYPELICDGHDGLTLVNLPELVPVLVKALQELQATIDSQSERISKLKESLQP